MRAWINVCRAETAEIITLDRKAADEATRVADACASLIVILLLESVLRDLEECYRRELTYPYRSIRSCWMAKASSEVCKLHRDRISIYRMLVNSMPKYSAIR